MSATRDRSTDPPFAIGVTAGLIFLLAGGAFAVREAGVAANDFSGFWAGARAVASGLDPFDPPSWHATVQAFGTQAPDTEVFGYPAWVAIALVPLALLPLKVAALVWLWLSVGLAIVALRALLRALLPGATLEHALFGVALFVAQPGYQTLENGQWTFILLAVSIAAVLLLREHHAKTAGLVALAWLAKPHLFLFAAAGMTRASRSFGAALVAGIGMVVVSSAIVIPGWWVPWARYVAPIRIAQPATIFSLLADAIGPIGYGAAILAVLAGTIVALRFRATSDASVAVWTALSLAAAPYAWSYDHVLVLLPIALAAGVMATTNRSGARLFVVTALSAYVVLTPLLLGIALSRGRETFSAVLPALAFVAVVAVLWPRRHDRPGAASVRAAAEPA